MRLQISTEDIPEKDRLDAWTAMLQGTLGMQAGGLPDASAFRVDVTVRSSGPLTNLSVAAVTHSVMRLPSDIARRRWDSYWIYREAGAGVRFKVDQREFISRPGDIFVGDADVPFETQALERYAHHALVVPKAFLDPHLPKHRSPRMTRLSGRNGVDGLAGGYIEALIRNWATIPEPTMHAATDTLARLVGLACGAAANDQPDAVRRGRLVAIKRHIARRLADPNLSPANAASALGLSVRALHLAFEPTGTSFARYVLRRRLEACRDALLANQNRPVIDIAFAWGFGTLSGFYRAFHAAFGMSPGDLRARSSG
ncbi:MAG TPA: helix-turn-helix domain-containing protein [Acetobacteraceae bacterium]|jgi:AraC-like DNA-binding protein